MVVWFCYLLSLYFIILYQFIAIFSLYVCVSLSLSGIFLANFIYLFHDIWVGKKYSCYKIQEVQNNI